MLAQTIALSDYPRSKNASSLKINTYHNLKLSDPPQQSKKSRLSSKLQAKSSLSTPVGIFIALVVA
jgi:hypothetical protein